MDLRTRLSAFVSPGEHDSSLVQQAPAVAAVEVVRRFWPFARPYRRFIALGLLLLTAAFVYQRATARESEGPSSGPAS